jgi:hypothetical protein
MIPFTTWLVLAPVVLIGKPLKWRRQPWIEFTPRARPRQPPQMSRSCPGSSNTAVYLVMAVEKWNFLVPHHLASSAEMARNGKTCITYEVSKQ